LLHAFLCVKILSLILSLDITSEIALYMLILMLEPCPLLSHRGVCEQLFYHQQALILGLIWSIEILFCGLFGLLLYEHHLVIALIMAHAAVLGRLFNLCLLFDLPGSLSRLLCCLISMPWLIILSSYEQQPTFLIFFLGALLCSFLASFICLTPALLRWHLEAFEWEIV
jgi:hypothetical protein